MPFALPGDFGEGGPQFQELLVMQRFVRAQRDVLAAWSGGDAEFARALADVLALPEEPTPGQVDATRGQLLHVVHTYNYRERLKPEGDLASLERRLGHSLLPCPTPAEYVDDSLWAADASAWLGHGYYWKLGAGEVDKDLGCCDFDCLEDKFHRLKHATVLVLDYDLLREDFPELRGRDRDYVNAWVLEQVAYISEGQVRRISPGGDLYGMLDREPEDAVDASKLRAAIRLKGGGRAAIVAVDGSYAFKNGGFSAGLIDVKGIGTTKLQPHIEKKACGFLSLVDALKEFAYQRLLHRIAEHRGGGTWSTVRCYGIVDTGINFRKETPNPATGYPGDRCVLMLRQRQSRLVSCSDEVVFYSVARKDTQTVGTVGSMRRALQGWGVSSEQQPVSLSQRPASDIADDVSGDWNIQTDAAATHLVDFSHFFVLPSSKLAPEWRMSEEAVRRSLEAGCEHFTVFSDPHLLRLVFNTDDPVAARAAYEQRKAALLTEHAQIGKVGHRKPTFSWSWFLEFDDSAVMRWASDAAPGLSPQDSDSVLALIEKWLPPR